MFSGSQIVLKQNKFRKHNICWNIKFGTGSKQGLVEATPIVEGDFNWIFILNTYFELGSSQQNN